jgi:hypothetical protein
MKYTSILVVSLMLLSGFLGTRFAQGEPLTKLAKLAPPMNVRVDAGENAIKVVWDPSPDEANYELAGYNVYFDTKSSILLSPDGLLKTIQIRKNVHECIVRGLENGQRYFVHVRSRGSDGLISPAGLEQEAQPQSEGKKYPVNMFDNDASRTTGVSGYGWSDENGQGIPGYFHVRQDGKSIDILMVELSSSKNKSVLISPSEADITEGWALRNNTRIVDIGTKWMVEELLPDSVFTTTTEIKKGHVYVLKTHDNYYVKLRIASVKEVNLLLPAGATSRDVTINKISFTYVSQLGQSDQQFLTGKP